MMGYHQWKADEKSIPLTAFVTQTGLYEYTRVPFGYMNNAPTNGFQQIMRTILASSDGIICEVYLDDVIISGDNPAELILNVKQVLTRLNDYHVLVKPSKCKFGMTEIEFLGHIINEHERKLLPSRTQKVLDLTTPRTPKQVRTFLGLCNAFKDYIPPDFAFCFNTKEILKTNL